MTSNSLATSRGLRRHLTALLATTAMLSATAAGAQTQPQAYPPQGMVQDVAADSSGYGGQLSLAMGGSKILRFERPVGQVMVGNPKVGDVIPLGERTLYVLGKGAGATSLTVMPRGGGAPLATLDVRVGYDVDNLRHAVHEILPDEPVEVTARGDGVVLTGTLSSSAAVARVAQIAEQYAAGHVVNLTSVRAAEQVMISVRVSEVQRSALQQLGLNNFNALWDTTHTLFVPATALNPDKVANLIGRTTAGKNWSFNTLFDALETHGYASTLAEPNLVALSGETAVFFAGGEIPVPIPQLGTSNNTITIEWKQYGVSIGFTPTVVGDTINLAVAPEVSALDQANAISLQGFKIPALTTRRAKTTVELRNGQSFAIAGLIHREFTDNLRGLPDAQRLPVFGSLFRSTSYQNNESEVIIIVTAHLAKPGDRQALVAPTDVREGPSEAELLFGGVTDKPGAAGRPSASLTPAPAPTQPAPALAQSPPAASAPASVPVPAPAPSAPVAAAQVAAASPPAVKAAQPEPAPIAKVVTAPAPSAAAPVPVPASVPAPAPRPSAPAPSAAPAAKVAAATAPVVAAAPPPKPVVTPIAAPAPKAMPAPVSVISTVTPAARPAAPEVKVTVAYAAPKAAPAPAPVAVAALPALKPTSPPPIAVAAPKPASTPVASVASAPPAKPAAPPVQPIAAAAPIARSAPLLLAADALKPARPIAFTPAHDEDDR